MPDSRAGRAEDYSAAKGGVSASPDRAATWRRRHPVVCIARARSSPRLPDAEEEPGEVGPACQPKRMGTRTSTPSCLHRDNDYPMGGHPHRRRSASTSDPGAGPAQRLAQAGRRADQAFPTTRRHSRRPVCNGQRKRYHNPSAIGAGPRRRRRADMREPDISARAAAADPARDDQPAMNSSRSWTWSSATATAVLGTGPAADWRQLAAQAGAGPAPDLPRRPTVIYSRERPAFPALFRGGRDPVPAAELPARGEQLPPSPGGRSGRSSSRMTPAAGAARRQARRHREWAAARRRLPRVAHGRAGADDEASCS